MEKTILLSDRGCNFVDAILNHTNWTIALLVADDFGGHREKYASCPRIKSIVTLSEILEWDGPIDLDFEDVEEALSLFHACDYGARRIMDDFHFSHYQFYHSIGFWRRKLSRLRVDLCLIANLYHGFPNDYILEETTCRQGVPCLHLMPMFNNRLAVYSKADARFLKIGQHVQAPSDLEHIAHYFVNGANGLELVPFPQSNSI